MSKKPTEMSEPHADFNWPPPDEELAQWFDSAACHEEFAQSAGGRKETSETSAASPGTLVSAPDAQREPALDGPSDGKWVAEIAQLQALLEALTEKVEWRVATFKRR